jgi:hypothetical protein
MIAEFDLTIGKIQDENSVGNSSVQQIVNPGLPCLKLRDLAMEYILNFSLLTFSNYLPAIT